MFYFIKIYLIIFIHWGLGIGDWGLGPSTDLMRTIFILFDNCCRIYSNINDIKKNEMNIKEIYNKGYQIYEIIQVIQEGKYNNEDIIKQINEYRKKENEKKEDKKDDKINNENNNKQIKNENDSKENKKENVKFVE